VYRRTPSPELISPTYHEAGHVATVLAFRRARWLPYERQRCPSDRAIAEDTPGQWGGACVGLDIYSMKWDLACVAPRYRDLMEAQVVIHLAGGIAEAIHRGVCSRQEVLRFAEANCEADADMEQARAVLGDLFRVTAYRFEARDFAGRTLEMLLAHWPAVEALAEALIEDGRIEGEDVERIIDRSMSSTTDGATVRQR
jgi:hypothetical protein